MNPTITILLIDDHRLFGEGVTTLLNAEPDMQVYAHLEDGLNMHDILQSQTIDLLLMDINLPTKSGITLAEEVKQQTPGQKVICLSMLYETNIAKKLELLGVEGYLPKEISGQELIRSIRQVMQGQSVYHQHQHISSSFVQVWQNNFNLTAREIEILSLIKAGKSSQEIANTLHRSVFTIDTHRKNIIQKLGLKNGQDLIRFAHKNI